MANEYVNKVVYNGNTLVDLTEDTVTPQTLSRGVTAHNAAGQQIVGQNDGSSNTDYILTAQSIGYSDLFNSTSIVETTLTDGTFALAKAALEEGKEVRMNLTVTNGGQSVGTSTMTFYIYHSDNQGLDGSATLLDRAFCCSVYPTGDVEITKTSFSGGSSLPPVSVSDDGKVAKVSSGAWSKGYQSWNDLTDKPFYEETDQGYNFEIDLNDQNYVSGYFDIGSDVPCKFYRVGDPLTADQLEGAIGTVNTGEDEASHVIESSYIFEIEENGDTVGLFVSGDMPYALVINNANTTIDVDATNDRPFGCSGTFSSAGTYLFWLDLSIMESGMTAYDESLIKDPTTIVHKIDSKYILNDYNELNNIPCQTKVYPAFNYVLPDMEEVEPDYYMTERIGSSAARHHLYRVGDPLSIEQILGSYLTISDTGYDDNSDLVTTNYSQYVSEEHVDLLLDENTQNVVGYTVYWEISDNFIAAVQVVNEDNVLVDAYNKHDGGIVVQSGTYLYTYEAGRGYPVKRLPTSISKSTPTEVYTPIDSSLAFNQIKIDVDLTNSGYATSFEKQLVSGTFNSIVNNGKSNEIILNIIANDEVLAELSFLMKTRYADVEATINDMTNGNTPSLHYVLRGEAYCVFNAVALGNSNTPSFDLEFRYVAELKDDDILYITQDINHDIVLNLNTGTVLADDIVIGNETVSDYKTNYGFKQIYKPSHEKYSGSSLYYLSSFLFSLNYSFGINVVIKWWTTVLNAQVLFMISYASGLAGINSTSVAPTDYKVSAYCVFFDNNEMYLGIL